MTRVVAIAVLTLVLAGCTSLVDTDDYTFEEAPCGPRPPACTGGREIAFVAISSDVPRLDPSSHRDGFDLDGTDGAICGQRDFTSAEGRTGIDNALAEPLELYEDLVGGDLRHGAEEAAVTGAALQLVVLSHVDDLANDDCIEVTRRTGFLPAGITAADLDSDHDGLLDAGLVFDYQTPLDRDPVGCVVDHVAHGRFGASIVVLPALLNGPTMETRVERGRLRMPFDADGNAPYSLVAGSIPISSIEQSLPTEVVTFLRPRADLDPSSRSTRDCGSISFAIYLDFVPCTLGVLHVP